MHGRAGPCCSQPHESSKGRALRSPKTAHHHPHVHKHTATAGVFQPSVFYLIHTTTVHTLLDDQSEDQQRAVSWSGRACVPPSQKAKVFTAVLNSHIGGKRVRNRSSHAPFAQPVHGWIVATLHGMGEQCFTCVESALEVVRKPNDVMTNR